MSTRSGKPEFKPFSLWVHIRYSRISSWVTNSIRIRQDSICCFSFFSNWTGYKRIRNWLRWRQRRMELGMKGIKRKRLSSERIETDKSGKLCEPSDFPSATCEQLHAHELFAEIGENTKIERYSATFRFATDVLFVAEGAFFLRPMRSTPLCILMRKRQRVRRLF